MRARRGIYTQPSDQQNGKRGRSSRVTCVQDVAFTRKRTDHQNGERGPWPRVCKRSTHKLHIHPSHDSQVGSGVTVPAFHLSGSSMDRSLACGLEYSFPYLTAWVFPYRGFPPMSKTELSSLSPLKKSWYMFDVSVKGQSHCSTAAINCNDTDHVIMPSLDWLNKRECILR